MENSAFEFIFVLLGLGGAALLTAFAIFLVRQRRIQRLTDPRRDYTGE